MNNQQKLDDIIFANRNKVYGAYAIRSEYESALLKSLFLMMGITGTVVLICFLLTRNDGRTLKKVIFVPPVQTIVYSTPVDLAKPKTEPISKSEPSGNKTKSNPVAILIRDSVVYSNDSLHTEEFTQTKGAETLGPNGKKENTEAGGGKSGGSGTKSDTAVALIADEYPEFEGGQAALNRWIASHLRYPNEAIDRAKQGKVHVKFVVDEQGKVLFPTILNKLGYGLEEEALRVVSGIPDFKSPAKIGGKAVKCYFVVPIHFKLY
jgi:periplasmic protein TonB